MASQLAFITLDVFTSTRYTGNPLAVVKVPQSIVLSQSQKQRIAREFNLSETVFLHEQTASDLADASVRIDIFTAVAEIPFAGHPTVGTANYLLRLLQSDPLNKVQALQAKAGRFGITLNPAVSGVQIVVAHNVHLHAAPFAQHQYPVFSIVRGMNFVLARQPDLEALGAQTVNLLGAENTYSPAVLNAALDDGWREGLLGTYFYVDLGVSGDGAVRNIRTRMFATREDPATGSAASALCSYLSLQQGKAGTYKYHLTQGVEMGQRSEIFVEVRVKEAQDGVEIDKVLLSGCAVLTMQGSLEVPEP